MMKCSVAWCDRERRSRVWCHGHYEFWRRTGIAPVEPFADTPLRRFWQRARIDFKTGCWIWHGAVNGDGRYGRFNGQQAHVWSYENWVGPVPDGLVMDHLCRVTLCVNPLHVEPVTQAENIYRGSAPAAVNRAKTHCKRDHPLAGENVYTTSQGGRGCRACLVLMRPRRAAQQRARRARLMQDAA